jgi:hypothetical protein
LKDKHLNNLNTKLKNKENFKIEIGPMTFDVEFHDELVKANGKRGNGVVYIAQQVIKLANDMPEDKTALTFWHEVMHVLVRITGLTSYLKLDADNEELAVSLISGNLYKLMKDNDDLL